MTYFWGTLIIQSVCYILILFKVISLIINLKKKKTEKKWLLVIIVLVPLLSFCVYTFFITPCMDLKYAISGETITIEGKVEKVYISGGSNPFILDGNEFRRNPWSFNPKEGEFYRLTYLPNSKYVISYELISN